MTVGSILDRAFRLYTTHFALIFGIVAITYTPIFCLQMVFNWMAHYSQSVGVVVGQLLVLLATFLIAYPLAQGAMTHAVSELYLGNQITIGRAYQESRKRFRTILNTQISVGLRVLLGFILLIIPGIIWALAYSLSVPVLMIEGGKTAESMRRSKELTKGYPNKRKIAVVLLFVGLINVIALAGCATLARLVVDVQTAAGALVEELATSVVSLIWTPLAVIPPILLYYDLRIRKEGFDLEMLSQALAGQGRALGEQSASGIAHPL